MGRRLTSPILVGRAAELAELEAALDRATAGEPSVVVIDGEAGLGKTRLAARLAEIARRRDAIILNGSAVELAEGSLPYAPLVGVLRDLAANLAPSDLVDVLGLARWQLGALVPELLLLAPRAGEDPATAPLLSNQTQLFEAVLGVTERLARLKPAVFILEDLQWADRSTLDLLVFLIRNMRSGRVFLLVTSRSEGLGPDHPLEHVLGELGRDRRTIRISLTPLDATAIAEQVRSIAGTATAGATIARIQALSDGNPFFVEELLAAGVDHDGAVPISLQRLLVERYRRLSDAAQTVARVVAIAGEAAGDELIARVGELRDRALYGALREAIDDHLLVAVETPSGERYAFRHALLREAIEADLLPGERRSLHAAIAAVLAESPSDGYADTSAALAHHWAAAGRWPEALSASITAGQAALAVAAYAEAAGQLARAAGLWDRVADAEARAGMARMSLDELAADAAFLAGDFDAAVRLARLAADLASAADQPLDAARVRRRLASYLSAANDDEAALRELTEARRVLPPSAPRALEARILATRGAVEMLLGRYRESVATCEMALELIKDADEPTLEAAARNFLGVDLVSLGRIDDGLAELRRAVELSVVGEPDARLEAIHNLAGMLDLVGRSEEALTVAQEGIALAGPSGLDRRSGAGLRAIAGMALGRLGRWPAADASFVDGLALDPRGEHLVSLLRERGRLLVWYGRTHEAADLLAAARTAAETDRRVDSQTWLVEASAELELVDDRPDRALALVQDGLGMLAGTDDILRLAPLCRIGLRAEADLAALARARREASTAAEAESGADQLIGAIRALPDQVAAFGGTIGTVTAADLATAEAEWARCHHAPADASLAAWRAAADAWLALAMPYPAAYARFRAAEAALEGRVDRDGATADLRAAAAQADRLAAGPLTRLVNDLARRARIELAAGDDGGDGLAAAGIDREAEAAIERLGLTRREIEVLGLIAEGRTNRQIAESLFITEKTAGVHVTNILAKVGVPNRVEAGAVARRLGIVGGATGPVQRTFLFTDIVRSTNLVEAIGDAAWVDLLGWHDRTLRAAFVRAGGEEIDHAGDGFFVAFLSPEAAATCAIAIQRALAEHRRAHGFAPSVRIGIHAGEAVRSGSGYAGRAIHEAARIAATASAGEIVASATTRFPASVRTGPRQAVSLRGLAEPVELVTIDWQRPDPTDA